MGIKERQTVVEEVIKPMEVLYGEIPEAWTGMYLDGLEFYGKEILRKAWKEVVVTRTYRTRPMVGEIREECEKIRKSTAAASVKRSLKSREDQRLVEVRKLFEQYQKGFSSSTKATQALQEKWLEGVYGLACYANHHAWLQAQILAGFKGFGYEGWAWGWGSWHKVEEEPVAQAMRAEIEATEKRGWIEVIVSEVAENWMKEEALKMRNRHRVPRDEEAAVEIKTLGNVLENMGF